MCFAVVTCYQCLHTGFWGVHEGKQTDAFSGPAVQDRRNAGGSPGAIEVPTRAIHTVLANDHFADHNFQHAGGRFPPPLKLFVKWGIKYILSLTLSAW